MLFTKNTRNIQKYHMVTDEPPLTFKWGNKVPFDCLLSQ